MYIIQMCMGLGKTHVFECTNLMGWVGLERDDDECYNLDNSRTIYFLHLDLDD